MFSIFGVSIVSCFRKQFINFVYFCISRENKLTFRNVNARSHERFPVRFSPSDGCEPVNKSRMFG